MLYRSFDDTLSDIEQEQLEDALATSAELGEEYERLVSLRRMISDNTSASFAPLFTQRVMQQIKTGDKPSTESEAFFSELSTMFRRVAVAATIAAVMAVSYNLSQSDTFSLAASFGVRQQQEPALEEMLDVTLALEVEDSL
ncbi:uncharacterized protein METZ01_LOCUS97973 [marine metagenome]|uniref:Uncharacterized protein n=1 Tax=marine metagenome TaxID=408172 RepID=A0A381VXV5_9ZZZZ